MNNIQMIYVFGCLGGFAMGWSIRSMCYIWKGR